MPPHDAVAPDFADSRSQAAAWLAPINIERHRGKEVIWLIDRNSIEDAQKQIEIFVPDKSIRNASIHVLADMIEYAHHIDRGNWNLNLDKGGNFLQFNTGQEYCIVISYQGIFLVCLKEAVQQVLTGKTFDVEFRGYLNKVKKTSSTLENIPDLLVKVSGSVGCLIRYEHLIDYISYFQEPIRRFISVAIRETTILPKMKNAHSLGSIAYISKITHKNIPNPYYTIEEHDFQKLQERLLKKAKMMTDDDLQKTLARGQAYPAKTNVVTPVFVRNSYLAEFVKRQAHGICQDCHQFAPFISKITGEPYLETHHIIPLSLGGKDTIENVIALCPNCHRKRHYG